MRFEKKKKLNLNPNTYWIVQALLGEIGMDSILESASLSLYNGQIPDAWKKLAPQTNKNLGGWIEHFIKRTKQYEQWVRF